MRLDYSGKNNKISENGKVRIYKTTQSLIQMLGEEHNEVLLGVTDTNVDGKMDDALHTKVELDYGQQADKTKVIQTHRLLDRE